MGSNIYLCIYYHGRPSYEQINIFLSLMRENNEGLVQGVLKKGANGTETLVGMISLKNQAHFFEISL